MTTDPKRKFNLSFTIIVVLFSIGLFLLPSGFENNLLKTNNLRVKAKILEVDNINLQNNGLIVVGSQNLKVKILSGKYRGQEVMAENILTGHLRIDCVYKVNDKILAILNTDSNGKITGCRSDSIYRIHVEIILFLLFAVFLVFFAGWTGFKALLSFVFTALTLWKILIPLFLKGFNPLITSFIIIVIVTSVIILLIAGFSRKGLVALLGSISGIAITTILAIIFGYWFQIPGTVKEFSETLLYSGFQHLPLTGIFLSGIFISASGALMDIAMDISAAQQEIMLKRPDIKTPELIRSGFHIARPVIGTMTTTLLFAYSGSFMFTFMVFMAKGTPMISIFNTNFIAAEILQTIIGSFGLVMVAPMTAIIGGFVFCRK